ncbi:MAG: YCF48-related protein [Ignavibacteriaceae bacterium]
MKTTDGGNNWITQMSGSEYQFEDVHFVNPDTGWVVGEDLSVQHYAVIFKTVDGGATWNIQTFGSDDSFSGVQFVNDNTGWVVGGNNNAAIILHTTNGGDNWIPEAANTTNLLSAVYFVDENKGWAVGFDGTIIHMDNTVPVGHEQSIPFGFSLKQNYPNPFNPTTTIQYSIPESGNVKLKVFNSIGEEVATLINDYNEAGIHKVKFDASDLSSGIYYYKIQSNNFSRVKKMILLR